MSAVLEARYRWLLRAYPPAYRRERGDEMIGTLMEAATPDQSRPSLRESLSLAVRGLQTRAGVHRPRPRGGMWTGAIRIAVLLLLADTAAVSVARTGAVVSRWVTDHELGLATNLLHPLETVLVAAALLLVAAGRYRLGLLTAVAGWVTMFTIELFASNSSVSTDPATGKFVYTYPDDLWQSITRTFDVVGVDVTMWPLPLAVLLTLPLLRWRPTGTPRPWLWLLAVPAAVILLPTNFDATTELHPWGSVIAMVALLLWAVVDARATIASATLLLPPVAAPIFFYAHPHWAKGGTPASYWAWMWIFAGGAVVLLAVGTLRARRQSRI